jgi:hypothetical protein
MQYQTLDETTKSRANVCAVGADMDTGQDDLAVMFGKFYSLVHEVFDSARPISTAGDSRRAESTVLAAAVLDAEQRARSGLRLADAGERLRQTDGCRNVVDRGTIEDPLDRRKRSQRLDRAIGRFTHTRTIQLEGRSASHDEAAQRGILSSRPTNGLPQIRLRFGRHRAAIEDSDIGIIHGIDDFGP